MRNCKLFIGTFLLIGSLFISSCKKDNEDVVPIPTTNTITEDITTNTTWDASNTYIIDGTVAVEGATLTIEPGAIIKFQQGAELDVGYNNSGSVLIANGTPTNPITFTSSATNPAAGDWDYIYFGEGASGSSMTYCNIYYGGGYNTYSGIVQVDGCHISMTHCDVQYSPNYGVVLEDDAYFTTFTYNNVANITNHPIKLDANSANSIGAGNTITGSSSTKGIYVDGGTFDKADATWLLQTVPYVLNGVITIQNTAGAQLTLQAGVTIAFTQGSYIEVGYNSGTYGTLIANGTAAAPITFTSASPSPAAGDWGAIFLENGTSSNTSFDYCVFEYGGGYNVYTGMVDLNNSNLHINHSIFRHSSTFGITVDENSYFGSFDNNTFEDCVSYPMTIYGNYAHTIGGNNTFNTTLGPRVDGDNLEQNGSVTWHKLNKPYYINGTLYINSTSGTTLNIDAGTQIDFTQGSMLEVGYASNSYGKIIAQGTASEPIIFTSGAPSPSNGDWDGIFFRSGTMSGTILDHCEVSYAGGYSAYSGNITFDDAGSNVTISNSNIAHSAHYGLYITGNSTPTLTNISYSDNTSGNTN